MEAARSAGCASFLHTLMLTSPLSRAASLFLYLHNPLTTHPLFIQITPYRAGHVLGAAMFMVDIGGMRCLYTGDYSRVTDRHLPSADMPAVTPHIGASAWLGAWLGAWSGALGVGCFLGCVGVRMHASVVCLHCFSSLSAHHHSTLHHLTLPHCLYLHCHTLLQPFHHPTRCSTHTPAFLPSFLCKTVIVESTYGTSSHGPREVRERLFLDKVVSTVTNGGRVLIPIVAIGRAQVCVWTVVRRLAVVVVIASSTWIENWKRMCVCVALGVCFDRRACAQCWHCQEGGCCICMYMCETVFKVVVL